MKQSSDDAELVRKYGQKQPSILGCLVVVAIGAIVFIYIFGAVFAKDTLWFWPTFRASPSRVVIHCYGQDQVLDASSPHTAQLAGLLNQQLSGTKRWDQLSANVEYYRANPSTLVLDFYYSKPVRIHSFRVFFSNIDDLLVPLDGANADRNPVFGFTGDLPTAGALYVKSNAALRDYLSANGLCQKP